MNEGNITVVDVIATDDGYQLSRPAQDLYIAYEVVRRHIDSDGVRHYAQMSSAKITDDGYEFKFETGDVFTCASHEDRPASATVSDAIAGGSSDEPLIGEHTFSPALINLYDPDSEDTTNYLSDGVEYDDGYVVSFDVSAAYERLKRGLPVWVRVFDPDMGDAGAVTIGLVLNYLLTDDDELQLAFSMNNYTAFVYCDNYTGESESDGE